MTGRLLIAAGLLAAMAWQAEAASSIPEDTIVIGLSADASTFEPDEIASRDNSNIAQHIFGTLYSVGADGKIVPNMAESYTEAEDGLSYTYKLKPGLTCEDGEPLTAEDVAYSFTRAADPANKFTGNTPGFIFPAVGFKSAEVVSDLEVKINITEKNPIAFGLMTEVFLHCKDSYSKLTADEASTKPVASGAYKLVSWQRGSSIELEKRDGFEGPKHIIWRIIPEASTRTAELMAGNVDVITNVAPDQISVINGSGNAEVKSVQGTRRMYVGFNLRDDFAKATPGGAAIQKPEVRRALQYAVDVPAICKQLLNFDCTRANGMVNPPNDNKALAPYPYDPDKAEQLLDEAGYKKDANGVRFELTLQAPSGRYLNDANVALAIGQYLSDIGVKTTVEPMEWASVYRPLVSKHNAGPLFFLGSGGDTWSALYDMTDLSTPDAGTNYTGWNNPEWFGAWKDVAAAKSDDERNAIVNHMLEVFYNDPPWLMLYFQPDFYGVSKRVDFTPRADEKIYLQGVKIN